MNLRKEKLDDVNHDIEISAMKGELKGKLKDVHRKRLKAAIENLLHSVDRLCFCIRRDYFKEKDWKVEYRDYIKGIIREFEPYINGVATKYNNIVELNRKWSNE